jgi:hypothetical protein
MSYFVRPALAAVVLAAVLPAAAPAAILNVTVTIENLAPADSISFAPLRLGFHNGTFDAFNNGEVAGSAIISIAEGGSGLPSPLVPGPGWFEAFAAAEPQAVLGSVGGALLPGATASDTFLVDTSVNPFFTFGTMVIPSNDFFLGNDSPTAFQLFDAAGNLLITAIDQRADDIWDAGSELFDPAAAAFLVGGNNDLRTPQGGVVNFNFTELSGFDGLTTAAGYVFDSQLAAGTEVYRITFTVQSVPEPASVGLVGLGVAGLAAARRLRRAAR